MHNRELAMLMAAVKIRCVCNIHTIYATTMMMNFLDNHRSYPWLEIHQPHFCLQIR
ncbi:hypothetical protein [Hoylesella buccalis]|uniref:hypothetical protein n=1 Tax=Hoylesella buccalis TaxID=28127 RepID=UPI0002FC7D19|nr:hypothetical protein [Hoylesella buccalis]